jgi:NADPH-dependent 2,4-dienoyl-CoA reductase/sulfur reductase-like enzyme
MTEAMRKLDLTVNLVEYFPSILNTLDYQLSKIIRSELEDNDVNVYTGKEVTQIKGRNNKLIVHGRDNFAVESDMVLVATGSEPNTTLAKETGISTGIHDAIQVNRKMETNLPDIYAAGDCVETYHNLLKEYRYVPLGTTAHKQGRIAGENAVGRSSEYAGSLATQSVKIFDLVAARTGLKNDEAREEGFEPITTDLETWDHKVYYPEAQKIHIRITGDRQTQRLLGAQIVGAYGTEVSKRLDILATAIHNRMKIGDLKDLDLSYTPPLSSPWDPVQMAAQKWLQEL